MFFSRQRTRGCRPARKLGTEAFVYLCTNSGLESLEDRRLLTVIAWDGQGDGKSWSDPANWTGNQVPGTTDDVVISTPGANIIMCRASHCGQ